MISANPGGGVHSGALVLSSGTSTLGLDVAIPANPCGDFCLCVPGLPGSVFTLWVEIFGAPVFWLEPAWVFAVEEIVSFRCPMPMVGPMPFIPAPQFLPLLHSHGGEGLRVSMDFEGVTCTQFKGFIGLNTWLSVKW